MKICPKCNAQHENEMTFCLHDGERLVFSDSTSAKTELLEDASLNSAQMYNKHKPNANNSIFEPKFENNIDRPKLRAGLVIGVIVGVLATFAILFFGMNYLNPPNLEDEATANSNKPLLNQTSDDSVQVTEVDPGMKIVNEAFYDGLKDKLRTSAKSYELKPLADTNLPKDSIEIRLSLFPDFYGPNYKGIPVESSILILKKDNSNWSGKIIRNVVKSNSDKPDAKDKVIESLNQPASGWENLWQQLQTAGVLSAPTKSEVEVKSTATLYVVESKEGGKYNYFYFHVPKEKSAIDEEKRVATIFNLIAKEFNASDLKAS